MARTLLVIDMLNDFAKKGGALYSSRIEALIPKVKALCQQFSNREDKIVFLCDAHDKDDKEFTKFPSHAIAGTEGAEIVAELKEYGGAPDGMGFTVGKKRYSGFFHTQLDTSSWLYFERADEVVVVGCCTDICVLYTVQELVNRDISVTVIRDCVDTYDIDDETAAKLDIPVHHADELNEVFFTHMKNILGVNVVDEYRAC